jgi:hypothetical protein
MREIHRAAKLAAEALSTLTTPGRKAFGLCRLPRAVLNTIRGLPAIGSHPPTGYMIE